MEHCGRKDGRLTADRRRSLRTGLRNPSSRRPGRKTGIALPAANRSGWSPQGGDCLQEILGEGRGTSHGVGGVALTP
jgi:hypothetical protein